MAKPTRRSVLRTAVVSAAAASVPLGVADRALSVVAGGISSGLRRSAFTPYVGSTFVFEDGGGSYPAVLTSVGDLVRQPRGHDKRFRLLFRLTGVGPGEGTYRVTNPKVGVDLFLTPIGQAGDVYEAIVDTR